MGFLGSFWGSAASSQVETEQEWRKLWQADQDREQRDRQIRITAEHNERMLELQNRQADDASAQFDMNHSLAQARLALDNDMFDEKYARDLFNDLQPTFDASSPVIQAGIIQSYKNTLGENEFAWPRIHAMEQSIMTSAMGEKEARNVLHQFFNPMYKDEQGNYTNLPDFMIQSALDALENDPYIDQIRADVEAFKDQRTEDINAIWDAQRAVELLGPRAAEAEIAQTEAQGSYYTSQAALADASSQEIVQTLTHKIENMKLENTAAGLDIQSQKLNLSMAEDFMNEELRLLTAQAHSQELDNKQTLGLMDTILKTAQANLEITESEARVALATELAKIEGENLNLEWMRAQIEQIGHDMNMDTLARQDALQGVAIELAASGHTGILEALGDDLFPGMETEDRERALELMESFAASTATRIEAVEAAEIALTIAQAENLDMQTSVLPFRTQTERLNAQANMQSSNAQMFSAETGRYDAETRRAVYQLDMAKWQQSLMTSQLAGNAPIVYMDRNDAIAEVADARGINPAELQEEIAELGMMQARVNTADALIERGNLTSGEVATLSAIFQEFGVEVPDVMDGQFDPDALQIAAGYLMERFNVQLASTAGKANTFNEEVNRLSGTAVGLDETLGFGVDMNDPGNLGAMIIARVNASSPATNQQNTLTYLHNEGMAQAMAALEDLNEADAARELERIEQELADLNSATTSVVSELYATAPRNDFAFAGIMGDSIEEWHDSLEQRHGSEVLEHMGISTPEEMRSMFENIYMENRDASITAYSAAARLQHTLPADIDVDFSDPDNTTALRAWAYDAAGASPGDPRSGNPYLDLARALDVIVMDFGGEGVEPAVMGW